MCGILGSFPSARIDLKFINHRGPDYCDIFSSDKVAMGHVRLSIMDLSERGSQPMWSNDKNVVLSYNGEIYNYKDLGSKDETCDTVTLVEKIAKEKLNFNANEIDGMYAFGAYFVAEKSLIVCRDPIGIKPLYLALREGGDYLAFSSEIKGFFGIEWFQAKPNDDIDVQKDFLQYVYTYPKKTRVSFRGMVSEILLMPTLIKGVYQICPGQKIIFSLDRKPIVTFAKLEKTNGSPRNFLRESILEQSMSDVEVGVQLSGGIDSSLVTYEYARQNKDKKLHGFYISVGYGDLCEDKWVDIVRDKISKITNFSFHKINLTKEDIKRVLADVSWHMDEPLIRHPNAIGIFLLCEYVKKHTNVKVLLTGEGADEIFGGYGWQDGKTMENYDKGRRFFDLGGSKLVSELLLESKDKSILERQLSYDKKYYLPPILARQDRMSMAFSIESRVPFLSNRFLGLDVPQRTGKVALKKYASEVFGNEFAYRKKCGFGFPWEWLVDEDLDYTYLKWMKVKPSKWLLNLPIARSRSRKWLIMSLNLWAKQYLFDKPSDHLT